MLQTVGYSTNKKRVVRDCVQLKCVYRVELEESQCKCVESLHSDGILVLLRTMLRIVG